MEKYWIMNYCATKPKTHIREANRVQFLCWLWRNKYSSELHHLTFIWWVNLILSSHIHSVSPLSLFSFLRSSFALFFPSLHLSLSVMWVSFSPLSQVVIKAAADGAAVVCYLRVSLLTTALWLWTQHTQTAAALEKWFTSSHIRHQRAWLK